MTDLRLCLLAPEFLPNWGGVGTYCIELAKALADKIELQVVTLQRSQNNKPIYSKKDMEFFYENAIKVHIVATSPVEDTFLYNAKFQLGVFRKVPSIVKNNKIDLIHTNFPHMPDVWLKISKGHKTTDVTTIHTTIEGQKRGTRASGLSYFGMDRSEQSTLMLYPMLKGLENLYLRKSRNLITVSNWMKAHIVDRYPFVPEINVIHNGVDTTRYSREKALNSSLLSSGTSDPIVLFSSRLTAAKGLHHFIQAIPRILKENKDAHFVFIGAGFEGLWIKQLKNLGIKDTSYTFLGYVDYSELPGIYAKSDVFVVPSLYENLPIRILEAMSCKSAVVATRVCAIPEVISHLENGMLVNPGAVEELADSVSLLLSDEGLRKRLVSKARKTVVEKFDWKIIADKTLRVYEKIMANSN
jgi:glycosyltransferase involved in cell wall biosynthesis